MSKQLAFACTYIWLRVFSGVCGQMLYWSGSRGVIRGVADSVHEPRASALFNNANLASICGCTLQPVPVEEKGDEKISYI